MIEVIIHSMSMDVASNQPVVILRSLEDGRLLPIWIGYPEATAILLNLQDVTPPRPLTHDLLATILDELTVTVDRVEIDRLEEGTFYATIVLTDGFAERPVDARPSDSIALAVRTGSPVFVADAVMDEAGLSPEESVDEESEVERFREFLNSVDPEDFGAS